MYSDWSSWCYIGQCKLLFFVIKKRKNIKLNKERKKRERKYTSHNEEQQKTESKEEK